MKNETSLLLFRKKLEDLKTIVIKSEIYLSFIELICSEETNNECEKVKLQIQQVKKQIELCQNQYLTQK